MKASKQVETKVKKGPPGAVFVGEGTTSKASQQKQETERTTDAVARKLGEMRVTAAISGEQIEAEERQKRVRKLRKSVREIEQLEEKARAGASLEKEQLDKVAKKQDILDQIDELESC